MKLLFLANRTPYPPYRGDKLKIYNLAKRLCKNHELILICFSETAQEQQYKTELEKVFKEVHFVALPVWKSYLNSFTGLWKKKPLQALYFHSEKMRETIQQTMREHYFDAAHVQHIRMAPYLALHPEVPRILDLPDAFSLYWKRREAVHQNPVKKWFQKLEQRRLYAFEKAMLKQYDLSLVCSSEDLNYLQKEHGASNVKLLPNGVDLQTFSGAGHDYSKADILLFTGNMDYAPNVDAVVYFKQEILPKILPHFPEIKFVIAGQRPVQKVRELTDATTVVTGFVEDMAAMYESASIVVAPLRFGAGTQNKVLEALAMGVPVVCSNIGFAGLGIENGEGAFMETDALGFAEAIIKLLKSEPLRKSIGEKGKAIIRQQFDWDVITETLEGYFEEVRKS